MSLLKQRDDRPVEARCRRCRLVGCAGRAASSSPFRSGHHRQRQLWGTALCRADRKNGEHYRRCAARWYSEAAEKLTRPNQLKRRRPPRPTKFNFPDRTLIIPRSGYVIPAAAGKRDKPLCAPKSQVRVRCVCARVGGDWRSAGIDGSE